MSNKIALVVGGANGLGAAVSTSLLQKGCEKVYIADMAEPCFSDDKVEFIRTNLLSDDPKSLAEIDGIDTLVITAGIGRLDYFENLTETEIDNSFKINSIAVIKLIKAFYPKIKSDDNFNCAVISSICGMVSSPLYTVYAATKAAVSRFIESLNAELCGAGIKNRVLAVAPGSIKGTKFHGGDKTDLTSILPLAEEIISKMNNGETLFVPDFEVYGNVIERYKADAEKFGLESYEYKLSKNQLETKPRVKVGYLTGSFDLFHVGHLNLLRRAKQYCDYLVVGVHTDGSHKGKELFIPLKERMEIVANIKYVDKVIECTKEDTDAYDDIKYDMLFVGSDYKGTERFNRYEKILGEKGVKIIYFPYTKGTSSTQLREKISEGK